MKKKFNFILMYTIVTLICMTASVNISIGQNAPVKEWEFQWGTSVGSLDWLYDVKATSDGGAIACGFTTHQLYGRMPSLIRVNANGTYRWAKNSQFSQQYAGFSEVIVTTTGSFVAIATLKDRVNNAFIVKTDDDAGSGLVEKFYNYQSSYTYNSSGKSIKELPGGGFIVCGAADDKIWLLKLNPDLSFNSETLITTSTTISEPEPRNIIVTSDGNYVITGECENQDDDFFIIKIDATDNTEMWAQVYDSKLNPPPGYSKTINYTGPCAPSPNYYDIGYYAIETSDHNYIAVVAVFNNYYQYSGCTGSDNQYYIEYKEGDAVFMKFDQNNNGECIVAKNVAHFSGEDFNTKIKETADGGFVIVGSTADQETRNGPMGFYLVKINSDASSTLWTKTISGPAGLGNCGFGVDIAADGSMFVCGNNAVDGDNYVIIKLKESQSDLNVSYDSPQFIDNPIGNDVNLNIGFTFSGTSNWCNNGSNPVTQNNIVYNIEYYLDNGVNRQLIPGSGNRVTFNGSTNTTTPVPWTLQGGINTHNITVGASMQQCVYRGKVYARVISVEFDINGGCTQTLLIGQDKQADNFYYKGDNTSGAGGTIQGTPEAQYDILVANINFTGGDIYPIQLKFQSDAIKIINCSENTADISVNVTSGGKPPFTFQWNSNPVQSGQNVTLPEGNYIVTAIDAAGCSSSISTIVHPQFVSSGFTNPTITGITTWNALTLGINNIRVNGQVTVEENATLTIQGNTPGNPFYIEFYKNSGIIVKPGGKLIIDNAYLDIAANTETGQICPEKWNGIQVEGTHSRYVNQLLMAVPQPNYPDITSTSEQGIVWMKNGSTIGNALTGILAGQGSPTPNTGGGVVWCEDAYFINNDVAINFLPYIDPEFPNQSKIENTTFDGNGIGVQMKSIYRLPFGSGVIFQNGVTGIKNTNADIVLENNVQFVNMDKGIEYFSSGVDATFTVNGNIFNNVKKGIYIQGATLAGITSNTFTNIPAATSEDTYGIFMVGSGAFEISENKFEGNYSSNPTVSGCYAMGFENSGTTRSNVFKNDMGGMDYGVQTQDNNPALKLRCNTFSEVSGNLKPIQTYSWFSIDGSLVDQGLPSCVTLDYDAAGNHWKENCSGSEKDIKSNIAFNYYAHNADLGGGRSTIPDCHSTIVTVNPNCVAEKSSSCDITNIGGGIINPGGGNNGADCKTVIEEVTALIQRHKIKNDSLGQVLTNLRNRIDGGNTRLLIDFINKIPAVPTVQLKNRLLNSLPLSDKAMIAVINRKQSLPPNDLRDVLIPNHSLSDSIIQLIQNKKPALPEQTKKEIRDAQALPPLFPKEKDLAREMLFHQQEGELLLLGLEKAFVKCGQQGKVKDILLSYPGIEAKRRLAEINLSEGNFADARRMVTLVNQMTDSVVQNKQVVNSIPEDNRNFCKLMNCLINNAAQGKTIKQLSSTDISTIREVVDAKLPISARAELIITEATGELFEHHLKKERKTRNAQKIQNDEPLVENVTEAIQTEIIKVYPNPTMDILNIEVNLKAEQTATLNIYNLLGQQLLQYKFANDNKAMQISTKEWNSGIYIYKFSASDGKNKQDKIIIIK